MKRYTKEQLEEVIRTTPSALAAAKKLGCCYSTFISNAERLNVEVIKNPHHRGYVAHNRSCKTANEAFQKGSGVSKSLLKTYLQQEREWKCECCGISQWNGNEISLEIHHINGDRFDHRRENLQILCPNCHSVTNTWRSRNNKGYNKYSPKVSDSEILEAIQQESSVSKALEKLGLSDGSNRYRVQKLLADRYLQEIGKHTKA